MPPSKSSSYAEEGTRAHELAEIRLKTQEWPKNIHDYDQEMVDAVEVYVDYVDSISKNLSQNPKSRRVIEHKFHVETLHPDFRGTADCVIYDGKTEHMWVIDYKHGAGIPVEAEENSQLVYYGLGAAMTFGVSVKSLTLVIVQPRYSMQDAIKTWDIEKDDLLAFGVRVTDAIKETEKENAILETGEHCRFCSAKPICPKLRSESELAMRAEFALAALPELSQDSLGDLLSKLDNVDSWVKGVREFAYQQAKFGRVPTGFKLVPKRATRKWADPEAALKILGGSVNQAVMRNLVTDPELKSPAQVEKILGKGQAALIAPLMVSVSSGDTLVPDSDRRETTSTKTIAEQMFGEN